MATLTRLLHRSSGSEKLVKVELVVSTAITVNGASYWTFTVRRRDASQTYGERIGDIVSSETRTIDANTPYPVYDDPKGAALLDGDTLWATLVSTGTPAELDNPNLLLTIQRIVR